MVDRTWACLGELANTAQISLALRHVDEEITGKTRYASRRRNNQGITADLVALPPRLRVAYFSSIVFVTTVPVYVGAISCPWLFLG